MDIVTYSRLASQETLVTDPGTGVTTPITRTTGGHTGLRKPDNPVVNAKVNGYRKPSNYNVRQIAPTRIPIRYSLRGTGFQYGFEYDMRGDAYVEVPVGVNELSVDALRTKLLNNIRGEVWDVAMTLAELSSTADGLGDNLSRLARSMDALKRRKPESFFYLLNGRRRDNRRPTDKFLRETAGSYLEWKYGIMPTVMDIGSATQALDMSTDGSLFDNPPLLVARAVNVEEGITTHDRNVQEAAGGRAQFQFRTRYRNELKARCDYRVTGDGLRGLNRYGIGLGTVATILFERTPFSFVLNMAIPIAELIKAWTALAGVEVVGYCETRYRSIDVLGVDDFVRLRAAPVAITVEEKEKAAFEFSRTAYSSVPMPLPFVRNPVKVGNMATVLALFTQLRKSS